MSSIQFNNVNKNFGKTEVLNQISFEVHEGEMVSLVGPSGSGKTTILRIIAGLTEMTSGTLFIDKKNANKMSDRERGTVIVYQDYALFPHMTVSQNIAFGLKVRKVSTDHQDKKVKELVNLLHMEGYENRYPRELSGGQKQRVALARALAIEPNVLLLDEPFSSLDTHLRRSMRELIKELQRKLKITTILVTHDIEEALMVSDRVAVLLKGQIAQFDTPQNIYTKPAKKIIADFVGGNATMPAVLNEGVLETAFGQVTTASSYSGPVTLMFKHNAASIVLGKSSNQKGIIMDRSYTGKTILYKVAVQDIIMEIADEPISNWQIGQEVAVDIDTSQLMIFRQDNGEMIWCQ